MNQLPLFEPDSSWKPPKELPDLRRYPEVAIDTETKDDGLANGIGPGWPFGMVDIRGISYAAGDQCGYIPLKGEGAFDPTLVRRWLADLYASTTIVFFNAPYDIGTIECHFKLGVPASFEDLMLAAYLHDENRLKYDLDSVCISVGVKGKEKTELREAAAAFGIVLDNRGRPKKKFSDREMMANIWKLPNKYVGPYAEQDARATLQGWHEYKKLIQCVWHAYTVDRDVIPITMAMRKRGVAINPDRATAAQGELMGQAEQHLATLGSKLGLRRSLDISEARSWQTLQKYFDDNKVPYLETANGQPSFTSEWMTGHEHWLPAGIAAIRQSYDASEKFLGNYILGYSHDDRIHAEIHSFRSDSGGTRSHRFSYSNPPLQQMPARVPFIKKLIRGVFEPDRGTDWLAADYSQQEPRLTVHYAAAERLLGWEAAVEYYVHGDGDYHNMVAQMTGFPRNQAKIINLGMAYGMGKALLAASLGVTLDEAERVLNTYHMEVPFIKLLTDKCAKTAAHNGFIKMIDGARNHFDMYEQSKWENRKEGAFPREKALAMWPGKSIRRAFTHKAMNRLIQGSAARQTKAAMIACYKEGFLPYLQMHDELDYPVTSPRECALIGELMANVIPLKVPVVVDLEVGKTWGLASTDYKEYYDAA